MTTNLIEIILQNLPRYAEEEGDFYSVPREELIGVICLQGHLDLAIAENTISLTEALLDTLALLNTTYLQKGEWCFVSFPAQLLAMSLLTAMSDKDSRFFAANFWNTQGITDDKKNQQREVLRIVENNRYEHHASHSAKPIRYIYVAWSIIKLDGKILFYQREDTQMRHDKKAGDYGLIGGRLNQHDLLGDRDMPALLSELQSEKSSFIKNALPVTLQREIREEAGLIFEQHYSFKPWRSLKPYQQVQGSAPNHALTEYYLDIFQIELTLEGYSFLQQQIECNNRLVKFSIDDMARGETTDGKIAYIKALVDDFDNDRLALKTALLALPDSFAARYKFDPKKYGLTLPIDAEKPLLAGVLGKEKPLEVVLSPRQLAILLGLAAHNRGFEFETFDGKITLHPFGWIEVKNNPALQIELIQLADLFKGTNLIIENHRDLFFRLSISPEVVYFDEKLFSFTVKQADLSSSQSKIPVIIDRESFDTALGKVKAKTEEFKLTPLFVKNLKRLDAILVTRPIFTEPNEENYETKFSAKIEDTYKKGLHKEPKFLALGLRSLIHREDGIFKFVTGFTSV